MAAHYTSGRCLYLTSFITERCWGGWSWMSLGWPDVSCPLATPVLPPPSYSNQETGRQNASSPPISSTCPKYPINTRGMLGHLQDVRRLCPLLIISSAILSPSLSCLDYFSNLLIGPFASCPVYPRPPVHLPHSHQSDTSV